MKVNIDWSSEKREDHVFEVEVTAYDCWSLDYTLAHVIHAALVKFSEEEHGWPYTDDEDVPEELKSTSAPPKVNDWDTDENHGKRWEWILKEMIWGFDQIAKGEKDEPNYSCGQRVYEDYHARIKNSTRLFGKYYSALWN